MDYSALQIQCIVSLNSEVTFFKETLGWVALPSNFYFGWLKKKNNSTRNQNQIDNLRVAFQPG